MGKGKEGYLSDFRQILGEFRDIDFLIRIRRENFKPQDNMIDNSIFIHEWIHYLQFLATPVGRHISYLRRTLLQFEMELLRRSPQPLRLPVDAQHSELYKWVKALEIQWGWQLGGTRWQLFKSAQKIPRISASYLTKRESPITLDLDKGAFAFRFPNGSQDIFEVGSLQVLEFMARAVEIDHACLSGYWEQMGGYLDIWDFNQFDYNAPILYLLQQVFLSDKWDESEWKRGFNGLLFPMLTVACQIALCYLGVPGKPFIWLLHVLGKIETHDDFWKLLRLAEEGRNTENWIAVADTLCSMAGLQEYSQLRRVALDKAKNEWDNVFGEKEHVTISTFSGHLKAEYESAILAHELMLKRPDVTGYPLRLDKELPFPIVFGLTPGIRGFNVLFLERDGSIPSQQPSGPAVHFWAWNHIVKKILTGSDLGCSWEDDRDDTLWYCPELYRCSQIETPVDLNACGRETTNAIDVLLGRCTNPQWKQLVIRILEDIGVRV